jgi:hypothetical protein
LAEKDRVMFIQEVIYAKTQRWTKEKRITLSVIFSLACSELRILGRARERDHVADVGHAGHKQREAFEAQAEARMRGRAVLAGFEVPPQAFLRDVQFLDAGVELVVVLLPLRAADDFADAGERARPWPAPSCRRRSASCRTT